MTVAIYNIYFWKDMLVLDVTSVDSLNYTLDFFIDYAEKTSVILVFFEQIRMF